MQNLLIKNKTNGIIFGTIFFILIGIASYFSYILVSDYLDEKKVLEINKVLSVKEINRDNCKIVLDFDKDSIIKTNKYFNESVFDNYKKDCDTSYNIVNSELELEFCKSVIKGNIQNFEDRYIILDGFEDVRNDCSLKYLTAKFSTGSFYNPENDFKSTINIDFSLPFYSDIGDVNSVEFIENRINAKIRLVGLLDINPKIKFDEKNIVLYENKAILELQLKPQTKYNFSLKSFDAGFDLEKVNTEPFSFISPKNKFIGILSQDRKTLYRDTLSPKFELVSYDSDKKSSKVKICRIDKETYAKIEVFKESSGLKKETKEFFKGGIDKLSTFECREKEIVFDGNEVFNKKKFNFEEIIGIPARSGLYYITFTDVGDREYNNKVQEPILFGIIDSHITMKISRNGEAFFFVNDFDGKPLAKQNIRVYVNNFESSMRDYNRNTYEYEYNYFSPLEKNIFNEEILLGQTGNDGILKVNIKDEIDGYFGKTFESYDYDWNGDLNGFFVTSASETNLTYVSSKWNGGISPWNFGYSIGSSWYGDDSSENADEISMTRWGSIEPEFYHHIYTDRKLYLPGEEVYIKGVLRNSKDLSVPKDKQINIKILNSVGTELLNEDFTVNDFGSISTKLNLNKDAKLGNYNIYFYSDGKKIGNSGFSVEVFKNPKFKNEIILSVPNLNEELVKITNTDIETTDRGYERKTYKGNFEIKGSVVSKYYSGNPVKNGEFTYKVYKQYYYDNAYWDNCYYGCYWEPEKELYTEGKGSLDDNGMGEFSVPVEFSSNYSDYKYITEVTVIDSIGDKISGSNSVIAKLPSEYKRWDPNSGIYFNSEKKFSKVGEKLTIDGGLTVGKFNLDYNDKFLLIIKKKDYIHNEVNDVRGQVKTISSPVEKIEKVLRVNNKNFKLLADGKLEFDYELKETGEYIFEFGELNDKLFYDVNKLVDEFKNTDEKYIKKDFSGKIKINWDNINDLIKYCDKDKSTCTRDDLYKQIGCSNYYDKSCYNQEKDVSLAQKFEVDDLIDSDSRKYFTVLSYGDTIASNPVQNDNKITVLSEKISYKLGEKARIMVRLPFSKGKVLWTVEKQGVLKSEYVNVVGNTFFKEFIIDDTFVPNAYIGVVAVDINDKEIPEYKVGYTEVVVDKSDKKTFVDIKANKKEYKPREEVNLTLKVKDSNGRGKKSELTVMVVDDSLISLMGNVDLNTLEKFYKKLPFQIQTSITNIAMLKNYYISRKGVVGGSGFGNFKGGDSTVSSRNIFKNTAYYNPGVITDNFGNAKVNFTLPDNLTNFRVMVVSNSIDNFFGYNQDFIEVRKKVLAEPKVPIIIRGGDEVEIGTNIFNNTESEIGFKVDLVASDLNVSSATKNIAIGAGENKIVTWKIVAPKDLQTEKVDYKVTVLGDSVDHSDKIEGTIKIEKSPILIQNNIKSDNISKGETKNLSLNLGNNTDISKSSYELYISKNPLNGIEKILSSLAKYPYGCIEQTTSSTMPNAILKKFSSIKVDSGVSNGEIDKNLSYGIERIASMQQSKGGFSYWQGDTSINDHITPYVVRSLIEMKEFGGDVPDEMITKAAGYLESIYSKSDNNKSEILWTLAKYYGNSDYLNKLGINNLTDGFNFSTMYSYDLISHTYALILTDKIKYKSQIEKNIFRIKGLSNSNNYNSYYYYGGSIQDKALFAQLLLDYNYDISMSSNIVKELYDYDWSSYYYSTKTKNEVFKTFIKYIDKQSKNNSVKLKFSLNGSEKEIFLNSNKNTYKYNVGLDKILKNNKVDLKIENLEGNPVFVTTNILGYPKDINKVPEYSNKVTVNREIYEVVDDINLKGKCSKTYSGEVCIDENGLKLHTGNIFKKGVTYKIKITSILEDSNNKQNFVIEDYLPSGFTILNSKFKTNSISTSQNTTKARSWSWSYTENNPGVVMAHAKNIWGNTATYEYFIRADFSGKFTYPPTTGYMMYNPKVRSNSKYRVIEIK